MTKVVLMVFVTVITLSLAYHEVPTSPGPKYSQVHPFYCYITVNADLLLICSLHGKVWLKLVSAE